MENHHFYDPSRSIKINQYDKKVKIIDTKNKILQELLNANKAYFKNLISIINKLNIKILISIPGIFRTSNRLDKVSKD